MNIGKRVTKSSRNVTASVVVLAMVSACASLPSLDKAKTVSLRTDFSSYRDLAVDVDGDPDTRPGRMAAEGFEVAGACDLCILITPISVPLYAAIGAITTAVNTLPEEQAHELNRVSANVTAGLNIGANFSRAMHDEASRQGIVLSSRRADARLNIVMTGFQWDVGVGNTVAIRIDFKVTGFADGKKGHRNIKYVSERAKVPEWVADSGQRIRHTLAKTMDEASIEVWQRILNRNEQTRTNVII